MSGETESPTPEPLPRLGLREALGNVIDTEDELAWACAQLSLGDGPIGLDAERASGYRYSQRAYLIQVRRHGSGTFLIDPTGFADLSELNEVIGSHEWRACAQRHCLIPNLLGAC